MAMKKILAAMAVASAVGFNALVALEAPALTTDVKVGFDTEFVERGRKEGKQNFKVAAEFSTPVAGGQAYVGASAVVMLDDVHLKHYYKPSLGFLSDFPEEIGDPQKYYSSGKHYEQYYDAEDMLDSPWGVSLGSSNRVSPYIGYSHDVGGWFTADIGYIAHFHTNLDYITYENSDPTEYGTQTPARWLALWDAPRNTNEIYLGAVVDVLCSPKAYIYYDFDREELNLVASISYSFDLSAYGLNNVTLESSGQFGYNSANRPYGREHFFTQDLGYEYLMTCENDRQKYSKDYVYLSLAADLVYKYNEQATVKAGVRYSINGNSQDGWANHTFADVFSPALKRARSTVWFASSFEFSF
ncbi:MAG: hypothetical protein LBC42_03640 [Puniceicoccales bacterium]|jgi:hypothetical protein|nr:hypothetical protein [Puniceicoccales bacterium]